MLPDSASLLAFTIEKLDRVDNCICKEEGIECGRCAVLNENLLVS